MRGGHAPSTGSDSPETVLGTGAHPLPAGLCVLAADPRQLARWARAGSREPASSAAGSRGPRAQRTPWGRSLQERYATPPPDSPRGGPPVRRNAWGLHAPRCACRAYPAAARTAARIPRGSARPASAISNAVPWSGDVRTMGKPRVTFTRARCGHPPPPRRHGAQAQTQPAPHPRRPTPVGGQGGARRRATPPPRYRAKTRRRYWRLIFRSSTVRRVSLVAASYVGSQTTRTSCFRGRTTLSIGR